MNANGHANGHANGTAGEVGTATVKAGLAKMLKGGVIMDVVTCLLYTSPSPRDRG